MSTSIDPPTLLELPSPPPHKTGWPWTVKSPQLGETLPDGSPWPKISIVTPSYNQGQFLEETIRSILLQGYPNLEYFVMDGGSSDDSVEIIRTYEPWITYWESVPDRGQSHAINKGFARVNGDIMAWLNSDDAYEQNALSIVARKLAAKRKTMLVGSSIITTDPLKLSGRTDKRKPTWEEIVYEARTFPQPSVFWTADLLDLAGLLDEELYFAMDYELWLRMYPLSDSILYTDRVLSFARSHPDQKGRRAVRRGTVDHFTKSRVYAALRAAEQRGESALLWLWRTWKRRLEQAIRQKNRYLLTGSDFHREALRTVLKLSLTRQKLYFPLEQ